MVDVWSGGTRAGVTLRSFWEAGAENPNVRLAGVYETGASKRYLDVAPVLSAIDAATTTQGLIDAMAPVMAHSAAALKISATATTRAPYTLNPVSFSNPRLKPFLRSAAESLAQIGEGLIAGGDMVTFHVGSTLMYNGGQYTGVAFSDTLDVYLSVEQSPAFLSTLGPHSDQAHPALFMHELGHILEFGAGDDYAAAVSAMDAGFNASNPPGSAYGSPDEPYTGEHPVGFTRYYGRTNRDEDLAEMVMFMTVPALYPTLVRWMQDDPYLAQKHRVVKDFLTAIGWGQYAIEDMHGHVPQVHPL